MSTSEHKVTLHDTDPTVTSEVQYGVRFPDGTIVWKEMDYSNQRKIQFKDIVEGVPGGGNNSSAFWWKDRLKNRAHQANIGLGEYMLMHTFLKRTFMISSTAPESVQAAGLSEQ